MAWSTTGFSSRGNTFDAPTVGRRYIILERFIEWLESLNPLDTAADEIGADQGAQGTAPAPVEQAPIVINLEAPKRSGRVQKPSVNQDATLEALALSRTAQTPNTNWRSTGANERRAITTGSVRNRIQSRSPKAN